MERCVAKHRTPVSEENTAGYSPESDNLQQASNAEHHTSNDEIGRTSSSSEGNGEKVPNQKPQDGKDRRSGTKCHTCSQNHQATMNRGQFDPHQFPRTGGKPRLGRTFDPRCGKTSRFENPASSAGWVGEVFHSSSYDGIQKKIREHSFLILPALE
jgi:hypothetical protein